MSAIKFNNVSKEYIRANAETFCALKDINIEIQGGEYVALMGNSRAGKSTLLRMMGCMERPTEGSIFINDQDITQMTDLELSQQRGHVVGYFHIASNTLHEIDEYYRKFPILLVEEPVLGTADEHVLAIMERLEELNKQGTTVVFITHDQEVGNRAGRIIRVKEGSIEQEV